MVPKRRFWKAEQTFGNVFSKALFTYVSTRFGRRSFEKCFENTFPNVCSTFQNLRLGTIILNIKCLSLRLCTYQVESSTESTLTRHQSMCDIRFCILLARKSQQHASSHIDRVDTSRCANMHHRTPTESRRATVSHFGVAFAAPHVVRQRAVPHVCAHRRRRT